jgi:hypothetical protein
MHHRHHSCVALSRAARDSLMGLNTQRIVLNLVRRKCLFATNATTYASRNARKKLQVHHRYNILLTLSWDAHGSARTRRQSASLDGPLNLRIPTFALSLFGPTTILNFCLALNSNSSNLYTAYFTALQPTKCVERLRKRNPFPQWKHNLHQPR